MSLEGTCFLPARRLRLELGRASGDRKGHVCCSLPVMADRSDFWKVVDRTKLSKRRGLAHSGHRACKDYFLETQSDSTLPPNEIITASERLTLIRSEIN